VSLPASIRRAVADFIALEGREAARRDAIALPAIFAAFAIVLIALAAIVEN
jgi:hypothetical protein